MVAVLSNALVEDRLIEVPPDITSEDLNRIAHLVTQACEGVRLKPLARKAQPPVEHLRPSLQTTYARVWRELRSLAKAKSMGKVIAEGTAYLVNQPEFQKDYEALTNIVQALEDANVLQEAIQAPAATGSGVSIGRENAAGALQRLAIIAAQFFVDGEDAGTIAVIGPTRMNYQATIPLVRQTARALTDALSRLMK
jgi:heat-inducible transcriptional repressor